MLSLQTHHTTEHLNDKISFKEFNLLYQNIAREVYSFWTREMQDLIARHCHGWRYGIYDFGHYLKASSIRYYKVYCDIPAGAETICDIGGFWGMFPILLKEIGYDVTMTEALEYYSSAFDPLFEYIRGRGVAVLDFDPFMLGATLPNRYNFITVLAVLEHYPHSLRVFMENVIALLAENGSIEIEVPNIAYLSKRIHFLLGRSPLTSIRDIYLSETPFIGHHHEFTMAELRDLADLAGLRIQRERFHNYWRGRLNDPGYALRHPLEWLIFALVKDTRGVISILCRKK